MGKIKDIGLRPPTIGNFWVPARKLPTKTITVTDHEEIGSIFRKLREKKGWSLIKAAKKMSVSYPHLSLLERGKRDWTEENISRAEKALKR